MQNKKAFLFDMDGTMLNNMQYHLKAWEKTVSEAGSNLTGDALFAQLYGKSTEVLKRIFNDRYSDEEIRQLSLKKEALYREYYGPHIALLPGLETFLKEAKDHGVLLAIATGTITTNVDFVIDKLKIRHLFDSIVSGSDVKISKPDPETFLQAAKQVDVLPDNCIVFEDVPNGVEAAKRACMKSVVLITSHKKEEFSSFPNIIRIVEDYTALNVQDLTYLASTELP